MARRKCLHLKKPFVDLQRLRKEKRETDAYLQPMNTLNTYMAAANMPAPAGAGMGYDAPDYGMRHSGRGMFNVHR